MKRISKNVYLSISVILNIILCGYLVNQYRYIKKMETVLVDNYKPDNRVLFIGNSIFERCNWAEKMHNQNIVNLGVGGITSIEILIRLNGLVKGYPKKVFFEMGSNDINKGAGLQDIIKNFNNIIYEVRMVSPFTKIYLLSVTPVNRDFEGGNVEFTYDNDKVDQLNETLTAFCKKYGITFVEVNSLLKNAEGKLSSDYTVDGIHLSDKGYNKILDKINNYVNE
jgi:lysophospholipase L1-like esterase